jgi:hypothetical protein
MEINWLALLGGAVAVIGQFWGTSYYIPLVGGIIAIVGAFIGKLE